MTGTEKVEREKIERLEGVKHSFYLTRIQSKRNSDINNLHSSFRLSLVTSSRPVDVWLRQSAPRINDEELYWVRSRSHSRYDWLATHGCHHSDASRTAEAYHRSSQDLHQFFIFLSAELIAKNNKHWLGFGRLYQHKTGMTVDSYFAQTFQNLICR